MSARPVNVGDALGLRRSAWRSSPSPRGQRPVLLVLTLALIVLAVSRERIQQAAAAMSPSTSGRATTASLFPGSNFEVHNREAEGNSGGRRVLRVCADPNNLPFSSIKERGFENLLAELIARELDADLEYTWWAQRRGFIRNTLRARLCDLVPGVPSSFELVLATRPYYRSTYVFLYRKDAAFRVRSLDDPLLKRLRIGVHLIGDDYANAPPAHALGARGIVSNVVGFSIYGNYAAPNPPAQIVKAVADGDIDVAIVWGPFAGYFAPRQAVPLAYVPVSPQIDVPFLPMVYDISMGVRRDDPSLRVDVEGVLIRRRTEVDAILRKFGVPIVESRNQAAPSR